jgi:hypothetical protein
MKKVFIVLLIVLSASCTSNTILEKPKDLIPKDTMVMLITDLFIAKSAIGEKNLNNHRKVNYLPLVYNKYKIDSVRFKSSNFYYMSVFEEYNLIYKEVEKVLKVKKDTLEKRLRKDPSDIKNIKNRTFNNQ